MKSSKGISKKSKTMDYTNYAYNEAVGRLKMMLADNSYAAPKGIGGGGGSAYLRSYNEDSGDNFSDNMSVIDRPVLSDISKYLTPSQKARMGGGYRPKKCYGYSTSKENLTTPALYQSSIAATAPATPQIDYRAALPATESVHAPVEIFNFIEKQEDYIEQLEKESKYCRSELTNLLGKVKDVINENEQLTENARNELTGGGGGGSGHVEKHKANISPSSDSDEQQLQYGTGKKSSAPGTPRKKEPIVKSPRYGANAPNIVYEARISELEAELMQANIDLKRVRTENEELNRKLAHAEPSHGALGGVNCETHRKQIEHLQKDKMALEETVRHLQKLLDSAKSEQYSNNSSSKRYINELVQMERSQAELEVKHLRDELDRQHERVRELQHEMARRLADERANAERRYNTQVDQLGGDLSSQWEQVAKLQLDLERQKRYESDMKRDVANRNAQIEELKMELRSNRSTFLADMAQANAEKQSLEQELNSLRLQLDRAARESKTEAARLNAEINSLRQRLDRGDADLLHSKREVLRLNDEISNLEKELAYGELKNEIRPTKKDLDKRISEMQDKHAETVNELEEMIQNQKQLMDKLTSECKTLTHKLEDTTLKHKEEISTLQSNLEYLSNRMLNNEQMGKLDNTQNDYSSLSTGKAAFDYKPSTFGTTDPIRSTLNNTDDYSKPTTSSPYSYDDLLGKSSAGEALTTTTTPAATTAASGGGATTAYEPIGSNSANISGLGDGVDNNDSYKPNTNNGTSNSNYNYGLNDNDDENLKDNIGVGEKEQQQSASEPSKDYGGTESAGNTNAGDNAGLTDYNTDYSAYSGYDDQQQYDPNAYDTSAYDPQQYEQQQQQQSDQPYEYDYGASDYGQTGYQYDATPTATAANGESTSGAGGGNVGGGGVADLRSPPPTTSAPSTTTSSYQPQSSSVVSPPSATTTAPTAVSLNPSSTATSRAQSRPSGGALGSTSAGGNVSGGKSALSQQSAASAGSKK